MPWKSFLFVLTLWWDEEAANLVNFLDVTFCA